jgi:hypothetical protein
VLPLRFYEPDKSLVITSEQLFQNPTLAEQWLGRSIFIKKKPSKTSSSFYDSWDTKDLYQATLAKLKARDSKKNKGTKGPLVGIQVIKYFASGGGYSTIDAWFDDIEWIACAAVKYPPLRRQWKQVHDYEPDESEDINTF